MRQNIDEAKLRDSKSSLYHILCSIPDSELSGSELEVKLHLSRDRQLQAERDEEKAHVQ